MYSMLEWQSGGVFSHENILEGCKRKREHKVGWLVWEFDCLHFTLYISMRPHGIDCKQT